MTRIKICGIQESGDALAAAGWGADFIGLVFVPGRRRKRDWEQALSVSSVLRDNVDNPPRIVGLFADQPLDEVNDTLRHCRLDMAQLCGSESLEYCARVQAPVIKVLHVADSRPVEDSVFDFSQQIAALDSGGHMVTLDRKVEGLQGGTGQSFNWEVAGRLAEQGLPFLLAGGLTPDNVASAVQKVGPTGVDVSSGVETRGVKDHEKIRAFIQAVRELDSGR